MLKRRYKTPQVKESESPDLESLEENHSNGELFFKKRNLISCGLLIFAISIAIIRYATVTPPVIDNMQDEEDNIDDDIDAWEDDIAEDDVDDWADDVAEEMSEAENSKISDKAEALKKFIQSSSKQTTKIVTFDRGDTLAKVLTRIGVDKKEIQEVSTAVARVFSLHKIKGGQQILIKLDENNKSLLKSIEIKPSPRYKIIAEKINQHFVSKKVLAPVKRSVKNISGSISPKAPKYSLQQCGLKNKMANDVLQALAQVTCIHQARSKVKFDLVYEQFCSENGEVFDSNLLAVVASVDGKSKQVYKFSVDGTMQYIDSNGTVLSAKRGGGMFIQPIMYKKITSRFGYRVHPISGRFKMHTGVDFSAGIGTPVRAAASGCIAMACRYSGYGLYIKIKHSGSYSTAYAHLSRICVAPGQYVSQGQVIGYSGNSGYSQGAHLHYELMKNGSPINPLSFVPQQPKKLSGKQLVKFNTFKKNIKLKNLSAS